MRVLIPLLFLAACAPQDPQVDTTGCPTFDLAATRSAGVSVQLLDPTERYNFVTNYNALDPPSHFDPDKVYILLRHSPGPLPGAYPQRNPEQRQVLQSFYFIMEKDGCVIEESAEPLAALELLLRVPGAEGEL